MARSRRGRGEGSIHQRADGLWVCSISLGYDAQGKRRRHVLYGKTKKEVQDKLANLHATAASGNLIEPQRATLAQFIRQWLEEVARPKVRESTFVLYERAVRLHIVPHIGDLPLAKIKPAHVQALYATWERSGKSGHARQVMHSVLNQTLQQAAQWGMISRNPCDLVESPKKTKRPMKVWSAEESRQFLETTKEDRYHALYVLALTTGMRRGELCGLQWTDLDFKGGYLTVQRSATPIRGKNTISEPKTNRSRRRIDLPSLALDALQAHRKAQRSAGYIGPWMFANNNGNFANASDVAYRFFPRLVKQAEVPKIRFHDMRHTAATLLLQQNIHPKVVQERLGHASIAITLDLYSHVMPSMQKQAAEQIDLLFKGATA